MSEIEWTNEAAIQLVEEYRKKPELWDRKHDLYRVHTAKYEAWSELAKTFDCDIADLRKKLNSLLASHRREKARVKGGCRSYWFLYNHLDFLPTHLNNNEGYATSTTVAPKVEYLQIPAAESDKSDNYGSDDEDHDQTYAPEEILIAEETTHRPKKKVVMPRKHKVMKRTIDRVVPKSSLDSKLLEALKILKKSDLSKKKDECDTFGEYIATSLRKHDEWTQSMIKQAINNILFEQEMKKYNGANGPFTVVVSSVDENPLIDEHVDK